ncbi:MAG: hypothetical protein GWM90_30995 [Gemmatimonadetes bacterium]|nr:polymer-forming cytoskeletal protein [Gemmatimonadota bacterium]NIQ59630.1 polymer-forming cytoskeletal protein [Gemmatimonadota bacterium]NIU79836.1 hypothetical protein [Gammaproteobacteria bacterium]NIX48329.1 hypothetical protein [Gemmatimonadota bacterium]
MRTKKDEEQERATMTTPAPRSRGGAVDSLIAPGMVLRGDCETQGILRVDGHVTGDIRANGLTVGPEGEVEGDVMGPDGGPSRDTVVIEGRVKGSVRAPRVEVGRGGSVGAGLLVTEATVRGRVMGTIVAEKRLLLEETAVVDGDVTAKRLGLKEGGQVFGTIRIGERAGAEKRGSGEERGTGGAASAAGAGRPAEGGKPTPGGAPTDEAAGSKSAQSEKAASTESRGPDSGS